MSVQEVTPARHRTAIRRADLSRPVRLAVQDGILDHSRTFFDYGCGHGEDVRRLRRNGFESWGWDPAHAPLEKQRHADVVNLGYVVNVIEDPRERAETLLEAWAYAERVLVVAARLGSELRANYDAYSDGVVTNRGTFQKFYEQSELRDWLEAIVGEQGVAAAPGIFYLFRDPKDRESFAASRYRTRLAFARVRRSDELYEAHKELLEPLVGFLNERGRLPDRAELEVVPEIERELGSLKRAFGIIRRVTETADWTRVREERRRELLIYLALVNFGGRPRLGELPMDLRLDIRALFGNYRRACDDADALLFSAGNPEVVAHAALESPVGKLTTSALYLHVSALGELPPVLRVYEGCARAYVGRVEEANIVKLHRDEPRVSYLCYPDFEKDPHPALSHSLVAHLQTFRISERDYSARENPPILHRKETFLPSEHLSRDKFARLTAQEERYGLYESSVSIGTRAGWETVLAEHRVRLVGHRLVRLKTN